jgi:hypothetical protein
VPVTTRERRGAGSVDRLLTGIIAGRTIATAVAEAGMSEATAHRRLAEPEVRRRLHALRLRVLEATTDRLAMLALHAVVVLGEVMGESKANAAVRVQAANAILSQLTPMREATLTE